LPAPLIAGVLALSEKRKGTIDPRWNAILAISSVNLLLSAALMIWLSTIAGDWMLDRLDELLGPFFLWPEQPQQPRSIDV
jgi:hypothetical protein